jgi:hypothetical protein
MEIGIELQTRAGVEARTARSGQPVRGIPFSKSLCLTLGEGSFISNGMTTHFSSSLI